MRSTRDLLRRRLHLVRKRGQRLAHIQNTRAQYNLPECERRLAYPANRDGVPDHFPDASVRKSIEVDLALLERYDGLINDLELTLVRDAKRHDGDAFHRLRSVPGIGKVLALTILYEIHDIQRFDRVQEFASYARLVKGRKQSGGKMLGTSGAKMGKVHLKWAFSEAAVTFLRHATGGKKFLATLRRNTARGRRSRSWRTRSAGPSSTCCRRRRSFRWRSSWPRSRIARGPARRLSRAVRTELVQIAKQTSAQRAGSLSIMSPRSE